MLSFAKFKDYLLRTDSFSIKYKDKSFLMKIIATILFFNKGFMDSYVTTIGSDIYFTNSDYTDAHQVESIIGLAHEVVHVHAYKKFNIIYMFGYLFPQILAIFAFVAIFAFINMSFLWFLLFLIFALPLPAYFRTRFERDGYKMTLYVLFLYYRHIHLTDPRIESLLLKNIDIIDDLYFKGAAYYFMWPFGIKKELVAFSNEILNGVVISDSDGLYAKVREAFEFSMQ